MVSFTHGKAQGELYLECKVWAENFYCIWRASYRTEFLAPTKGRAFMNNETPPPVSISFFQNASFVFFHFFPLDTQWIYVSQEEYKKFCHCFTSGNTLQARCLSNKLMCLLINMDVEKFKLNTESFNFELWFEQRLFNSFINRQPYFYKGPLNL
jgi:hypothetical protein